MEQGETDREQPDQGIDRREEPGEMDMDWSQEIQIRDGRVAAPADTNAFWLSPGTSGKTEQKALVGYSRTATRYT